jgi:MFS family permease
MSGFRRLWLAGLISDTGDWLLFVSLPIVVYERTGSTLGTAVAFLVELAPSVLLAPAIGRLADRPNRPRTLVAVSLAQAAALTPLLAADGLGVVYAVIALQAALAALFGRRRTRFSRRSSNATGSSGPTLSSASTRTWAAWWAARSVGCCSPPAEG